MLSRDAEEALEKALQNAHNVLGKRPTVVTGISDESELRGVIFQLQKQLDDANSRISELEEVKKSNEILETKLIDSNALTHCTKQELETANYKIEEMDYLLQELTNLRKADQVAINNLQSELKTVTAEKEKKEHLLETVEALIDYLQSEGESKQSKIEELIQDLVESYAVNETIENARKGLTEEVEALKNTLFECDNTISDFKNKLRRVTEKRVDQMSKYLQNITAMKMWFRWRRIITTKRHKEVIRKVTATASELQQAVLARQKECNEKQASIDKIHKMQKSRESVHCQFSPEMKDTFAQTVAIRSKQPTTATNSYNSEIDEIARLRWELDRMSSVSGVKAFILHKELLATLTFTEQNIHRLEIEGTTSRNYILSLEKKLSNVQSEATVSGTAIEEASKCIASLHVQISDLDQTIQTQETMIKELDVLKYNNTNEIGRLSDVLMKRTAQLESSLSNHKNRLSSCFAAWMLFSRVTATTRNANDKSHVQRCRWIDALATTNRVLDQRLHLIRCFDALKKKVSEKRARKWKHDIISSKYCDRVSSRVFYRWFLHLMKQKYIAQEDNLVLDCMIQKGHTTHTLTSKLKRQRLQQERALSLILRQNSNYIMMRWFYIWRDISSYRKKSYNDTIVTQHLMRLREAHYHDISTVISNSRLQTLPILLSQSRRCILSRYINKWKRFAVLVSNINRSCRRKNRSDAAGKRLQLETITRETELTAFLLDQATERLKRSTEYIRKLEAANKCHINTNQMLSSHNQKLRNEIHIAISGSLK